MAKELKFWMLTLTILGERRLVLVVDHLVSGADKRLPGVSGVVHLKNCLTGEAIPEWIDGPGVWIGALANPCPPRLGKVERGCDTPPDPFSSLERFSVGISTAPPTVLPFLPEEGPESVFVTGGTLYEATDSLKLVIDMALMGVTRRTFFRPKVMPLGGTKPKASKAS